MDARVWEPRRYGDGNRTIAIPVSAVQARAERKALGVVLAKPCDHLLQDVGLARDEARNIMARTGWAARIADFVSRRAWRNAAGRGFDCFHDSGRTC